MRFILILITVAVMYSTNFLVTDKLDSINSKIDNIVDSQRKIDSKYKRIMNVYGTRLTLVEKEMKKHHDFKTLSDLTGKG